jgi:hypothetical protein
LLEEEMRRVLAFLQWHANWWDEQAERCVFEHAAEKEGNRAYAMRQAAIRRQRYERFANEWSFVATHVLYPEIQ